MEWMKAKAAAQYAGNISIKTLYAAVQKGRLKAAHHGPAERNLLFCEAWIDEWLLRSSQADHPADGRAPIEQRPQNQRPHCEAPAAR
jgi:hypothetical protein